MRPRRRQNSQDGWLYYGYGGAGCGWFNRQDPPFWPYGWDYKVETLTSGWLVVPGQNPVPYPPQFPTGKYCLTNYGGGGGQNQQGGTVVIPAAITYIQLITDYTQLMPGFVNCLAYRLAMELCIGVTEDKSKFQMMEERYRDSLNSAEAQNETMDTQLDEDGSDSWVRAGRWTEGYGWGQY